MKTIAFIPTAAEDQQLVELVEEITEKLQSDESCDVDEYIARYPQYADRLRDWIAVMTAMADLGHSIAPTRDRHDSFPSPVAGGGAREGGEAPGLLGDFRILREVGRGGMGVVYEAEQVSLGRRVALKVLPFAAMLDRQQLARFKNEARAAATLDHPNIVAIHSVGCERGVHYYAMQLIEGQSLAQVVEQLRAGSKEHGAGRKTSKHESPSSVAGEGLGEGAETVPIAHLPTLHAPCSSLPAFSSREYYRTIARLGIQAAEALDHAHQNGILHRDIKPANLLVESNFKTPSPLRGGPGRGCDDASHLKLWITDFGLARIEQDAGMTMTGDLLGTLRYMSPEQALAKRVVVDHRSDIYSLGVTLYELLTLQPAFTGDDRHELLRQISFEEPRTPRRINARIPQDLETIVLKAIEKNPADRYATAREFADDLGRFSEDRSIQARRPTLIQRARKLIGRHRIAAAITVAAAFLLVIVTTAQIADGRRQAQENNEFLELSLRAARAVLESDDVEEAVQRMTEAQARIEAAHLVDQNIASEVTALKRESERYAKFSKLYKTARNDRGAEGVIIAEALGVYQVIENPRWFQALKDARLPEAHINRVSNAVYELLLQRADDLIRWPDYWPKATREARLQAQCREAIELLEKAIAFHAPSRGYYWLLANCSLIMGDREKEQRLRTTALETPPHDAAELFYINRDHLWGTVSVHRGYPAYTFDESYKDHREMLRLDPTYYNGMFFMALRLAGEGRHEEALVGWYACVMMHPDDYGAILNRGETHSRLGHYDEAKADYETVLAARSNRPAILGTVAGYLATDPNQEMRDGKRALELAQKACKLTDYEDAGMLDTLASAYAETDDFESAIKWSEMAVELSDNYLRDEYVKHLESFRQGKPWRDE